MAGIGRVYVRPPPNVQARGRRHRFSGVQKARHRSLAGRHSWGRPFESLISLDAPMQYQVYRYSQQGDEKMLLYHAIDFRLSRGIAAKQWWEQTHEKYAALANAARTCRSTPKLTELRHWRDGIFVALNDGRLEAHLGYYDARVSGFRTYWGLAFRSYDAARQRRATRGYLDPWGRTPKEQTVHYQAKSSRAPFCSSIFNERRTSERASGSVSCAE